MLRTDKWIYYDLEKTGCTYLDKKLRKICNVSKFFVTKKHERPQVHYSIPKLLTIRDPFLWYFSLWSYGLDGKGSFAKRLSKIAPHISELAYKENSKDSFSYFLDFALSCSHYSPRLALGKSAIPFSCDIYTTRIITMLVAADHLKGFSENLAADLSKDSITKALNPYMPDILMRTSTLNQDFHQYARSGKLEFLNLKQDWDQVLPLEDKPRNASKLSSSNMLQDKVNLYLSMYHRELINCKSQVALHCLEIAQERLSSCH